MDLGCPRKRKQTEPDLPEPSDEMDHDITFLAKVEPPEIKRSRLLKILVGDHVQFSSRGAVQDILTDPAYFHCDRSLEGDSCRILIPEHLDSYAAHVVLLAALNPGMPLNCKSNVNGLTLKKLHDAATFLKIDGQKIDLEPLSSADDSKVQGIQIDFYSKFSAGKLWQLSFAEMLQVIRKDFLAVPCELDVYKAVKKWCDYDAASRMTREILSGLLVEIRWELLVDMLEALVITADGPLLEVLSELQRYVSPKRKLTVQRRFSERHVAESVLVFYADRSQAELKKYNWEADEFVWDIPLPKEMKQWRRYKEMGPPIDGEHLLFRASSGKDLKTWSYSVVTKEVRFLFKKPIKHIYAAHYPLACIDGWIYTWDFQSKGQSNCSSKFHQDIGIRKIHSLPEHFREEAAFEAFNGKFYYCGGRNLAGGQETVSTVEMYDAETNKWTKLPDMGMERRCFAAKVHDGYLYVTGGAYDGGTGVLECCERLNLDKPETDWELIGELSGARYDHCMMIVKGQLYVCGGFTSKGNDRARQPILERYNVKEDSWEEADVNLRWPITSCTTCVMSYA